MLIEAGRADQEYWRDLWRYRELFYFLTWRDILVRYKQTTLGVGWALVRPALTTIAFTLVFSRMAGLPSDGIPYPLLVFAAMLPWQLFANAVSDCSNSLIANSQLISKVYFPRLMVPTGFVITSLVDFALALVVLGAIMSWYQYWPDWRVVLLPLCTLMAFALSLGVGLWVATLNVKYRDFRNVVPFIIQFGLYVSPVGFQSGVLPEQWRLLYSINPMVGVIDGFRWVLLRGSIPMHWPGFALSVAMVVAVVAGGLWYFRRTERTLADVI